MKTIFILLYLITLPLAASDEKTAWFGIATHENIEGDRYLPGVVIGFVWVGSPAAKAGLLEDDVVISVGGARPRSPAHLGRLIRRQKPGSTITIDYHRNGKAMSTQIILSNVADARERGAMLTQDFQADSPIQSPADISPENAKQVWGMIENDTKMSLLSMGFSPEHVAKVIAQMQPAGAELVKIPPVVAHPREKKSE